MTASARAAFKVLAEAALVRSGAARMIRRQIRGRALVLAYHNVVPTGQQPAGEASLHLSQADFAWHLDVIASTCHVVSLQSLFDPVDELAPPRVVITFDDAYLGAITAGLLELRRRSMPATVFVAPGLLGGDTWWDNVAEATGGVIPDETRRYAIQNLEGDRYRVLEWFAAQGGKAAGPGVLPRIANEAELVAASRQGGVTFGAHSWSHRNLSALSPNDLQGELAPSLDWLRARFTNTVGWLSYPYGLRSRAVEVGAERANFQGAFLVKGGWMGRSATYSHALPRLGIPAGLSLNGLKLRLAGIASTR